MINAEDTAARIGGIVDNDCRSLVIDERLHVAQVHLPVLVRQEVVLPRLNTCNLEDRYLTEKNANPWSCGFLRGCSDWRRRPVLQIRITLMKIRIRQDADQQGKCRIRIRIKMKSRIRISIKVTSQVRGLDSDEDPNH